MTPADLDALRRAMLAASQSFRLGMDAQANEAFLRFVDGLGAWLQAAGQPESGLVERATRLNGLLPRVLQAQGRGDGLAVADLLEWELLPLVVGGQPLSVPRAS